MCLANLELGKSEDRDLYLTLKQSVVCFECALGGLTQPWSRRGLSPQSAQDSKDQSQLGTQTNPGTKTNHGSKYCSEQKHEENKEGDSPKPGTRLSERSASAGSTTEQDTSPASWRAEAGSFICPRT